MRWMLKINHHTCIRSKFQLILMRSHTLESVFAVSLVVLSSLPPPLSSSSCTNVQWHQLSFRNYNFTLRAWLVSAPIEVCVCECVPAFSINCETFCEPFSAQPHLCIIDWLPSFQSLKSCHLCAHTLCTGALNAPRSNEKKSQINDMSVPNSSAQKRCEND